MIHDRVRVTEWSETVRTVWGRLVSRRMARVLVEDSSVSVRKGTVYYVYCTRDVALGDCWVLVYPEPGAQPTWLKVEE